MASVKFYLDTRRQKKDGTSQLKLVVHHQSGQRYISLGIHLLPSQWDAACGAVTSGNRLYRQLNIRISQVRMLVDKTLLELPAKVSLAEMAEAITKAVFGEDEQLEEGKAVTLIEAVRRHMAMKTQRSTIESYDCLLKHLERYCGDVSLDTVTARWLEGLDAHMAVTAKSANARAIYMRNLRAVFNFAIDEGWTQNYPFRKFKIKTVATAKRSMSASEMRQLLTMEVEEWQRPYRDFFALSFFLIGTNAKDIMYLPSGADGGGRIEFNRAKTRKLYSIKVEPEARAIIDRYRGSGYMISIMDGRTDHRQYIRQCNHALKMIGTTSRQGCKSTGKALWPGLTTYWARHSWATIAAELDVPKETIAAALGHDMGNSTTAIYINYNYRKVDDANRRVIDYVLYGRR